MGRRASARAKQSGRRVLTVSIVVAIIATIVALTLAVKADSRGPGDQYSSSPGQPIAPVVFPPLSVAD